MGIGLWEIIAFLPGLAIFILFIVLMVLGIKALLKYLRS